MNHTEKFELFISPSGFIEEKFIGRQTPESAQTAVDQLIKLTRKLKGQKKRVLILVDITGISKVNTSDRMKETRQAMVKAMKEEPYDRLAVYGNMATQVLVNTMALIAGKRNKVRVFDNRIDALKWLKNKD